MRYLASPGSALVTLLQVTEAAYLRGPTAGSTPGDDVQTDLGALRDDARARVTTLPGRLVAGLLARRSADAGPLTILSWDNLPGNGEVTPDRQVHDLAEHLDPALAAGSTTPTDSRRPLVDRITPGTTDADRAAVREAQGYVVTPDPVPTEPFHEWVISGAFPAGRPAWDAAGAADRRDDVEPFEQPAEVVAAERLHSQLAIAGGVLGPRAWIGRCRRECRLGHPVSGTRRAAAWTSRTMRSAPTVMRCLPASPTPERKTNDRPDRRRRFPEAPGAHAARRPG